MSEIIISKKQLKRLIETAMDLDIYVQPKSFDTSNGNEDIETSLKDMISMLQELQNMFQTGKKIFPEQKTSLYKSVDELEKIYNEIKFNN